MHKDILEVFIDAADTVLRTEIGIPVFGGVPEWERNLYLSDEVTVLVNLLGDVSGQAIYGMKIATAQAIISRILGQDIDGFDELARSGIGELGNVITGQAGSRLAHLGLTVGISVPMLLLGAGSRISTLSNERFVVPLETELGMIRFDLAMRVLPLRDGRNGHGLVVSYALPDELT